MAHLLTTEERAAAAARDAALVDAVIAAMPARPILAYPPLADLPDAAQAAEHHRRSAPKIAAEMAADDAAAAQVIISAIEAVGVREIGLDGRGLTKKRLMIFAAVMKRLWPTMGIAQRRRHFTDPAKAAFGIGPELADRYFVYRTTPRSTFGRTQRRERLPYAYATVAEAQAWIDAQPPRSDRTYEVSRPIPPGRKPKQ